MEFRVEIKSVNTEPESRFKAIANIILDDMFIIRNAKLFITHKTYITMPSVPGKSGKRFSPCHPLTTECYNALTDAYLDAYHFYLNENGLPEPNTNYISTGSSVETESDDEQDSKDEDGQGMESVTETKVSGKAGKTGNNKAEPLWEDEE